MEGEMNRERRRERSREWETNSCSFSPFLPVKFSEFEDADDA
jgi:hypothetical protein